MFRKVFTTKNTIFVSLLLIIAIASVACGNQKGVASITNKTWQWVSLVETLPASQSVVPNPENYTLILMPDSSLSIKADCNMAGGTYTLKGDSLELVLGPSTMAYCGEQSLDQQFLMTLQQVSGYSIENGQLVLLLEDSAGKMSFKAE
jgi:heat shock protein HslJ